MSLARNKRRLAAKHRAKTARNLSELQAMVMEAMARGHVSRIEVAEMCEHFLGESGIQNALEKKGYRIIKIQDNEDNPQCL